MMLVVVEFVEFHRRKEGEGGAHWLTICRRWPELLLLWVVAGCIYASHWLLVLLFSSAGWRRKGAAPGSAGATARCSLVLARAVAGGSMDGDETTVCLVELLSTGKESRGGERLREKRGGGTSRQWSSHRLLREEERGSEWP
ncbi:hypothetical protein KY285_023688 [Solanum tuberosum]|nr:hypothetical protein KY289_024014 [Solanum tuberosum]KAH0675887.1 hypothetical protein KY285_023688 [Solanum tuberosum]